MMRLEELADRARETAADAGRRAETPPFTQVLERRRRRSLVTGWAAAATVVAAVVVAALWLPPTPEVISPAQPSREAPVIEIPPPIECGANGRPVAVTVSGTPDRMAVGSSAIWVSDWDTGMLTPFDSTTLCPLANLTVGEPRSSVIDMVSDGDRVWVADFSTGSVVEVTGDGNVGRTIQDVRGGAGMVVEGDDLYVACCGIGESVGDDPITRVDTNTGAATVVANVDWPSAIGYGNGSLWVGSYITNQVTRLDPVTGDQIAAVDLPEGVVYDVAATGDSIWVTSDSSLIGIDPSTNSVSRRFDIPGARSDYRIMIEERSDGLLWVHGEQLEPLLIDPATGTTVARIDAPPNSMKPAGQQVVVATASRLSVLDDVVQIRTEQIFTDDLRRVMDVEDSDRIFTIPAGEHQLLARIRPEAAPHLYATSCDVLASIDLPDGWEGTCLERTIDGQRVTGVFQYGDVSE